MATGSLHSILNANGWVDDLIAGAEYDTWKVWAVSGHVGPFYNTSECHIHHILLSAVFNVSDTKEFENQQLFALNIILTPEGDEHQEVPGSSAAGCS